jgi:uracil-DNA glycosylase family 4
MFIAEAPGRFGADRTGVPLHGDRTGDNFEALLETAGLSRSDCFITNAVLCNPRDGDDRNRRPRAVEIGNCTDFLRWQIELIQPAVVATLGAVALDALRRVEDHSLVLAGGVGKLHRWFDRLLFPLYHPSPLAGMHRSRDLQRRDFIELASQAARLKD